MQDTAEEPDAGSEPYGSDCDTVEPDSTTSQCSTEPADNINPSDPLEEDIYQPLRSENAVILTTADLSAYDWPTMSNF